MTVFLSYAHQDADVVNALRQNLEDMGQSVWIDETLYGGQLWWEEILRQVRECHVFVLAVSLHSLASEACLAESEYATAVRRPFLPVRIDDVEMTTAPKLLRDTQHIDYKPNEAPSVIALAKALHSVRDSVPLPTELPAAPPTPQSYRDRYAALLGADPLALDEQLNYFVRLTVDIDTANSEEALELLRVLREREDLSWKVRQRIDSFLNERQTVTASSSSATDTAANAEEVDETPPDAPADDEKPVGTKPAPPAPHPRPKRLWWVVIAAAAALVVAVVIILTRSDPTPPAVQQPENDACGVDTCSDTPIRFFLDLADPPDQITVTLTDQYDNDVPRVDAPSERVDRKGLEWTWRAQYDDPIGTYLVSFAGAGGDPIEKSFTVSAQDGPFGVVQQAAAAISEQDWPAAEALDHRIGDELASEGEDFLKAEYPRADEKHWLPYDASGTTNDASTTIVGAYIVYSDSTLKTFAYCEIWAVDLNRESMRSDQIVDDKDQQVSESLSGRRPPSEFSSFVESDCYDAAHPS